MAASGGYGTHVPVLAGALAAAPPGPVLELGSGNWSSHTLHQICAAQGRRLVTADTDGAWMDRFASLVRPWHSFVLVKDWDRFGPIESVPWAVVLVDHAPEGRRGLDAARAGRRSGYIVAHDSERPGQYGYGALDGFRYRRDWKHQVPWTTVVSNTLPIWPE